jgi:uncharacterized Zn finger protein (UPF0148 family)
MKKYHYDKFIKYIKNRFPKENIKFSIDEYTDTVQVKFIKKNIYLSFSKEKKIKEIVKYINSILYKELEDECAICFTEEIRHGRIFCTQCNGDVCILCYIKIFRRNKGIIICPFCRYTYGNPFHANRIENGVEQILERFHYANRQEYYEHIAEKLNYSILIFFYLIYLSTVIYYIITILQDTKTIQMIHVKKWMEFYSFST